MAQTTNRGVRAFLGIFVLVGIGAIIGGGWILFRSLRCESWPTTQAVIATAEIQSHSDNDGGTTYSAEVSYTYRVDNVSYTGTRLAFGAMSSSSDYAQEILNRYPVGKTVVIHYSPDAHDEAVLETGIHGGTWICFGVGTVFVLAGIMFGQIAAKSETDTQATTTANAGKGPPLLMGVIFMLVGSSVFFGRASHGTPQWIVYVAGSIFVITGISLILARYNNKVMPKILGAVALVLLLTIAHWVAFGAGERVGDVSTPFSHKRGTDVRTPFIAFTIFFDIVLVALGARWLAKREKK